MFDWLAHRANVSPQKVALIAGERGWTYKELNQLVAGMAGQLATAGIEAGQHVAVLMPNRVEVVCLIHALARLQAVMVPLNIRLTADELHWQVHQADCSFIICDAQTEAQAVSLLDTERRVLSVDQSQKPGIEALDSFASDSQDWQSRFLDLEAIQGIVFTSGTTGRPKGAMLTFGNHFWGATASAYRLGTDPADRWLVCMPLYHVGGIAIIFRCCLYGTTVILQSGFEPSIVSQVLQSQQITLVSLVPTMLLRLLETHRESLTSSQLRCILLGGAATQPSLLEQTLALNLPVATTYGLTEATSQVATRAPGDGCVGLRPLVCSQIRIADGHDRDLPDGEPGELLVRGPTVMREYVNRPEETARVLGGGWLHTGDVAVRAGDGSLEILERRSDLIISGGENVYPSEVEQVLLAHPTVAEAAVTGIDDPDFGQRAAAWLVPRAGAKPDPEQLRAHCREHLAAYKVPVEFRTVSTLPRNAAGKLLRRQLTRVPAD